MSIPQAFAAKKESTKKDSPKKESKARPDKREIQAREAFAAGRFREAVEIYAKLYAESLHPTYLRNIGRCHQNMGNAEEAIVSFRDYLRKATLAAGEKEEVEGFIKEMEALKQKQAEAAQPKPEPAAAPPPVAPPPPQPVAQPAGLNLQDKPAQPESEESHPFYTRTWFWIATGVVVAAGVVGGLWAGGVFSKSSGCRAGYDCNQNP